MQVQLIRLKVVKYYNVVQHQFVFCISRFLQAVVDSSLRTGRQLDQDSVPLKQLFLLLDLCLRHGLRPRSRLLGGGRRDLWEPLQQLERFDPAAAAITATARQLR